MQTATIERMENISLKMQKTQRSRPRTKEALKYVLECNADELRANPYDDSRFSYSLLQRCKQLVKHMPQTSLALAEGYSPFNFDEVYGAIRKKH